jgi:hypothetical protein
MASVQRRRLRRAHGWGSVRRCRSRSCLAAAHRRARPSGGRRGARSGPLPRRDGRNDRARRHDSRAGMGCRGVA